jgi:hypothetical protein
MPVAVGSNDLLGRDSWVAEAKGDAEPALKPGAQVRGTWMRGTDCLGLGSHLREGGMSTESNGATAPTRKAAMRSVVGSEMRRAAERDETR